MVGVVDVKRIGLGVGEKDDLKADTSSRKARDLSSLRKSRKRATA